MASSDDMSHLFRCSRDREERGWIDNEAYISNDGRSDTQTTFYARGMWDGTPAKKEYYEWLARLNDGYGDTTRKDKNNKSDWKRMVDVYSGQFEFSDYQQERVQHIVNSISMDFGSYSHEKSILAICTIVANESNRMIRSEDIYCDLLDSIESDKKDIRRLRKLVRGRMFDSGLWLE